MRLWAIVLLSLVLVGCASTPSIEPEKGLFNDPLFSAASERISADDVFALSDEMKRYLSEEIASRTRTKGSRQGLFDALYAKGQLKLEYDSLMTRNAAQAFAARSGNCLSLVIMTAAFAKQMSIPVWYQSAFMDEMWTRIGDIHFLIGHVNVTLGSPSYEGYRRGEGDLTIDFLPPEEIRGLRTQLLAEKTIVAMYMNNRAAELLAQGQLDNAYWWARAAIVEDPQFWSSYNTLGVIYRHHGNPSEAQRALGYALANEPANTRVMSNLVSVLNDLGRVSEATALASKLTKLEPDPAFSYFDRGLAAMRRGDLKAARDLFAKEVDRAPYYHEFHYWLAVAYVGLGEIELGKKELTLAMKSSTTQNERAVYAAKLDRINAHAGP